MKVWQNKINLAGIITNSKTINMQKKLIATISKKEYLFNRMKEFTDNGESLEVYMDNIENAQIKKGQYLWERYVDFLPFDNIGNSISLGEGNTPLIEADRKLEKFVGLDNLYFKKEMQNPTGSFKDRGSLSCIAMAKAMKESVTATISTGNMGHSIAAYGARSDIKAIVFVPGYTAEDKIRTMSIYGAQIIKVIAPDYSEMKKQILELADKLKIRTVSGNGPIRVEGYKLTAFEMFEQMQGKVPDYIAVPTSACGHIRGIFKGYRELKMAGYINRLPKMIIVQAKNNSPIVSAIKKGHQQVIPFSGFHTIAEAITTGNPMGGQEIIHKATQYGWLAEDVSEEKIIKSQKKLAESGYFVQPASAASLHALKKLRAAGKIEAKAKVIMMLTGSGLKDRKSIENHQLNINEVKLSDVKDFLKNYCK